MPFVVREDVGTTRRRSLSGHSRLKTWERTGGICVVCDQPIDGFREHWIVEHIRALELGGADEIENMGPAHDMCAGKDPRGPCPERAGEAAEDPAFGSRSSHQSFTWIPREWAQTQDRWNCCASR